MIRGFSLHPADPVKQSNMKNNEKTIHNVFFCKFPTKKSTEFAAECHITVMEQNFHEHFATLTS